MMKWSASCRSSGTFARYLSTTKSAFDRTRLYATVGAEKCVPAKVLSEA